MSDWKKFVAAFDPHGDNQDPEANTAFFKFVKSYKPEIRVAGGDVFDFRQLRKGADAHERKDSMKADVQAGKQWLTQLNPTHYLRGNHCERLWDLAEQAEGVVADYAREGVADIEELCKKLGTEMFPYNKRHGILRLGHLKIIHGFLCGVTAARRTAQIYGSVLMGHGHGIQHTTIEGLEPRMGRMCGCLCKLEMGYNRAAPGTLAWEHGWAYGVVNQKTGLYQVWQAQKIGNDWLLPSKIEKL